MALLLYGAGVGTGGAFLTGGSVGSGLSALTHPADTLAPAAAQQADAGHAGVDAGGAVALLPLPTGITVAGATVTAPVACTQKKRR